MHPAFSLRGRAAAKTIHRDLKQRLTIEQWHFPGYVPLVEMSTKTVPADVVQVYGEVRQFLQRYGLSANGEQEAKTRRALEFLSK